MTTYLLTLKTAPPGMSASDTYKNLCQRCHGEKGDGHGVIAWYLDPYPRDLSKAGFMDSKPLDRSDQLHQERRAGHVHAGLGQRAEGRAGQRRPSICADHVSGNRATRSNRRRYRPPIRWLRMPSPSARGETMFLQRCSGCHGRKADGKGPNSLDILPRPRNLRNRRSWTASPTSACSNRFSTGSRARPCRPGSIMGCRPMTSATSSISFAA